MSAQHLLRASALVALLTGVASAGVVTGTLRDSSGQPVRNALFQVESLTSGIDPIVSGGFSNANGDFTTTITPDGPYRIVVLPLAPPESLVVTKRLEGIQVGPSVNHLGVIELEVGVELTGRVVGATGIPLFEVQLDFVAGPDAQPLDFRSPDTNINGYFRVAVPRGACKVRFKPGAVPYYGGPDAAPVQRTWHFTGPLDAGTIVMPQGYGVSGQVIEASTGAPVEDAEIKAVDTVTGEVMFTPGGRTSETGSFVVVLPQGRYDFHAMPRSNDGLGTQVVRNRAVPPGLSLGTIALPAGYELRGRVRDTNNDDVAGVRVELFDTVSGEQVFVANNVTTLDGHYRMEVPGGTFDVRFLPPLALPLQAVDELGFTIADDESLDATLPPLSFFNLVGSGTSGTGGLAPVIASIGGAPRIGNFDYGLRCSNARGGAYAQLQLVLGTPPAPGAGSRRPAGPMGLQFLQLSGPQGVAGAGELTTPLPIQHANALVGLQLRARFLVFDPAAPGGIARTNELQTVILP